MGTTTWTSTRWPRIVGTVPGLPRPEIPPGPRRDLVDALHSLHHRAGWPSLRALAREVGCSPTTVSSVFSHARLPKWGLVELLVETMGGEAREFRELWLAASLDGMPGGSAGRDPTQLRIAGRRAELSAVRRELESGANRLLLVTGEAGIGKTRLVAAAAEAVEDEVFVAVGSCLPLATEVPFLPVADLLQAIFDSDDGQWMKEALADCPPYVPGVLKRILPEVDLRMSTPPQPEDDSARQRLFAAVGTTLSALGAQRPLALVVEDLHWADSATLDLLDHVLAVVRRPGLRIVGTYRTEDPATSEATMAWFVRARRLPGVATVELGPLTLDETRQQLELLSHSPADVETVNRIHRRAEGNPLFAEQLAAQPDGQPMPALLADLLDQRLLGIGTTGWPVARTLASAAQPLTAGQLSEVTGLDEEALAAAIRELVDLRLLRREGHEHSVELRHALLAEAIRRRMVAGEAVGEHRRLAAAMAGWGEAASAAQIATHWQLAESAADEFRWRVRAAQEAAARHAARQESEQWLRAIELWPLVSHPGDVAEVALPQIYAAAVDAIEHAGDAPRAAGLATEALTGIQNYDEATQAGLYLRSGWLQGISDAEHGLELLGEALERYERLGASRDHVRALKLRAALLRGQANYDEADATVGRALGIATELDDPVVHREILGLKAWGDMEAGRVDLARVEIESAQCMAVGEPDPYGDISLGVIHSDMLLKTAAAVDDIEDAARRGIESAAAWGIDDFRANVLLANVSQAMTRAGHVDRAAALILPLTECDIVRDRGRVHAERAHIDALRGQFDEAAARFDNLGLLAMTSLEQRAELARDDAECRLWRGDTGGAFGTLVTILGDVVRTPHSKFAGDLFAFAARAAADAVQAAGIGAGDAERERLLNPLQGLRSAAIVDPFVRRAVPADGAAWGATWSAELTRLAGDSSVQLWLGAASEWDALARPFDAAYCRWRAAEALLRTGQQGTAAGGLIRRAARDAREHVPLLAAIRATLDKGSGA